VNHDLLDNAEKPARNARYPQEGSEEKATVQRESLQTGKPQPHSTWSFGHALVQVTLAQLGASSWCTAPVPCPQHALGTQSESVKQVFPGAGLKNSSSKGPQAVSIQPKANVPANRPVSVR
jgi:hypothetical protein